MKACLLLVAVLATASAQGPLRGEVAFAAPPANETEPTAAADCANPCYVVQDYSPYRTCQAQCNPDICARNYGVWASQELCCAPGVAFPEGCSTRPSQCWVVESFNLRTCIRDDRKCLQGYGVFPNEETCCAPGAAFPEGCAANLTLSPEPCFVVDTYYPARTCRATRTACDTRGQTVRRAAPPPLAPRARPLSRSTPQTALSRAPHSAPKRATPASGPRARPAARPRAARLGRAAPPTSPRRPAGSWTRTIQPAPAAARPTSRAAAGAGACSSRLRSAAHPAPPFQRAAPSSPPLPTRPRPRPRPRLPLRPSPRLRPRPRPCLLLRPSRRCRRPRPRRRRRRCPRL
ncbi:MAG: hypothetical protein J3K34DRAFT_202565 [Monoraphidium minutum]|nr:MAG: hypothetical protein J3K34DRAFT_202565 [Monoraphidium minutum]